MSYSATWNVVLHKQDPAGTAVDLTGREVLHLHDGTNEYEVDLYGNVTDGTDRWTITGADVWSQGADGPPASGACLRITSPWYTCDTFVTFDVDASEDIWLKIAGDNPPATLAEYNALDGCVEDPGEGGVYVLPDGSMPDDLPPNAVQLSVWEPVPITDTVANIMTWVNAETGHNRKSLARQAKVAESYKASPRSTLMSQLQAVIDA